MSKLVNRLKQLSEYQTISEDIEIFPDKDNLKNNYAQINLKILIEQGYLLTKRNIVISTKIIENDYINLEKLFIEDIKYFLTEYHRILNIKCDSLTFGQTRLASDTLYHIVNSKVFKDSYKPIDLLNQDNIYDMYSLPFLIRVTVETQIKSIIGFDNIQKSTPSITRIIDFLIKNDNMVSIDKITLKNVQNIYSWSSSFIHTGEKEPIWLVLKALQKIKELFTHKDKKSQYMGYPINYMKIPIKDFEKELNMYLYPNNKNKIELSENNFEIKNKFYNETQNKWISS